ncbi:MAG TPA: hypothetical protein VK666_03205 [Chryseolinea sp.]|nr:hypothetical protein [Chryseolinea sp.]
MYWLHLNYPLGHHQAKHHTKRSWVHTSLRRDPEKTRGGVKPALMLSVVNQMFKPWILVEIEVIAYGAPA